MNIQLLITGLFAAVIIIVCIVSFSKINSLNNKIDSIGNYFDDGNLVGIKSIQTPTGWTIQDNGHNELQIALKASKNTKECGATPTVDNPVLWLFKTDGTLYGPSCGDSTTPQIGAVPSLKDRSCDVGTIC
jgi:hypothetical protein